MASMQFKALSARKAPISYYLKITSYLPIDYIHLQGDPVHSGSSANGNICAAAVLTEGK